MKFKRCHGKFTAVQAGLRPARLEKVHELGRPAPTEAAERMRIQQQGLGKRIESFERGGRRFVIAGDKVFHSNRWKTFIDFLQEYFARAMGVDWLIQESHNDEGSCHPLISWRRSIVSLQDSVGGSRSEPVNFTLTGGAVCYFGLAYSLYLLEHNVELQRRYIERLRNIGNFQGAYYELLVANVLIQAGFKLELEDETDSRSKHCEFSAISPQGRKYWVEAKMRSVAGLLGKSQADGVSSKLRDPTTRLTGHINEALAKPAADERLIFIDLNAPFEPSEEGEPGWLKAAVRRLDARDKAMKGTEAAYVFVTNFPYHRYLQETSIGCEALAHGLGIPDFGKPGNISLIAAYRQKQKHLDAHDVLSHLRRYPNLPSTFDGSLPSASWGNVPPPIRIGQTYFFEDVEGGIVGTVTSATVMESEALVYVAVSTNTGKNLILSESMSQQQLEEWRRHPEVYFGEIQQVPKSAESPFEFFEILAETSLNTPREKLLENMKGHHDIEDLMKIDQENLALIHAERMALLIIAQTRPYLLHSAPSEGAYSAPSTR